MNKDTQQNNGLFQAQIQAQTHTHAHTATPNKISVLTGAILLAMAVTSNAQPLANDTDIITVTATRTPIDIDTALASVVVINQADIARMQAKSINDILASVAGIDLISQGGRGQNSSLFLRGANANQTLVLIDGVRVSSASLGSTNIQAIAPELIERIEIVKGPRAAIWGSDAIGGVIQIFTRQLASSEYFAGATIGSDNYRQLKAGAGVAHGDGQTSISINHEASDGFDVLKTAEDDDDGFETNAVAIRGQQQVNSQFNLDWMARADHGESEYDNAYGGANETKTRNHAWLVRGAYQQYIGHVNNHTSLLVGQNRDYSENYRDNSDNHLPDSTTTRFETRRDQVSLLNHSQVFPWLQFNIGADYYHEKLSATTVYDVSSRDVFGGYIHGLYSRNGFTAEAAVRYDDVENIDSETSYNAGVGYQLTNDSRIALNLGSGFKAPTFNDLYYPADAYSSGNPELVSETSDSIELVFESKIATADIALNAYSTEIDNLIVWQADENYFYQPQNVDKVDINGIEFSAAYQGFGGQHQLNASYIDAKDKATDKQLIRRAKQQFSYQFDTQIGALTLFAEYQYHGKRFDSDFVLGRVTLASYQLVNIAASYPLTKALTVEARVTNLFDEDYETAFNYQVQERAGYVGISYAM
ncbi:TonB-dependent receptor domain-containing protein [Colwellia sp. MEBiC06753]